MSLAPHILIVDADGAAARVTDAIVARVTEGVTRAVEQTAEGAWRSAQRRSPDVLLLDLSPARPADGRLIREVKAFNPRAVVIALTALASPAVRRLLRERQVDVVVEKGSAPEELVRALRDALGRLAGPS